MNARTLARLLVLVALACAGSILGAAYAAAQDGTVVQNGNDSVGSAAISAPVAGGNLSTTQSGPSAAAGGHAAMVGDTDTTVAQDARAEGAPVSAGSQTTEASGGARVQNSNSSAGAVAVGTPVVAFNSAATHNGPAALGGGASARMVGDGSVNVAQLADAEGGPADAGSQFTRANGPAIVQNVNSCGDAVTANPCGIAVAGPVVSANVLGIPFIAPSGAGPVAVSVLGAPASAALVGDADAILTQGASGVGGAAGVGFQGTVVGGGVVQNANSAARGIAVSGPTVTTNGGFANAGPTSVSVGSSSSASQFGGASGSLDQVSTGGSGDAFSGSQTTESVGDLGGIFTVLNRSASEDDVAVTGLAAAGNLSVANGGPVAVGLLAPANARLAGNAGFDVQDEANAVSGDALAGSQSTEALGGVVANDNRSRLGIAVSGPACASQICGGGNTSVTTAGPLAVGVTTPASAAQFGNDASTSRLRSDARTGLAGAGFQKTQALGGVVATTNDATLGIGVSGPAIAGNLNVGGSGPAAFGFGTTPATAGLFGNASNEIDGNAIAFSGDALTGGQTTKALGGAVLDSNRTLGTFAFSGFAAAGNALFDQAGPVAFGSGGAFQNGDARIALRPIALGASGDAVSGVQATNGLTGVSANDNRAALAGAFSANACASPLCAGILLDEDGNAGLVPGGNLGFYVAGPVGGGLLAPGNAFLNGNASIAQGLAAGAISGDAVAGSQIGSGGLFSANANTAIGVLAGCGFVPLACDATAGNVGAGVAGPIAFGFDAPAASFQHGNAAIFGDPAQKAFAVGGNSIAGSQIGGSGQRTNNAFGVAAFATLSTAFNGLAAFPGPIALGAGEPGFAALAGDAVLGVGQDVGSTSGDAFAGSQVSGGTGLGSLLGSGFGGFGGLPTGLGGLGGTGGLPAGTDLGGLPISGLSGLGGLLGGGSGGLLGLLGGFSQQDNLAVGDVALSGPASGFDLAAALGPVNGVQAGGNRQNVGQLVRAISGPAIAGSQVGAGGLLGGLLGAPSFGPFGPFEGSGQQALGGFGGMGSGTPAPPALTQPPFDPSALLGGLDGQIPSLDGTDPSLGGTDPSLGGFDPSDPGFAGAPPIGGIDPSLWAALVGSGSGTNPFGGSATNPLGGSGSPFEATGATPSNSGFAGQGETDLAALLKSVQGATGEA
jgi:hypothetical protein